MVVIYHWPIPGRKITLLIVRRGFKGTTLPSSSPTFRPQGSCLMLSCCYWLLQNSSSFTVPKMQDHHCWNDNSSIHYESSMLFLIFVSKSQWNNIPKIIWIEQILFSTSFSPKTSRLKKKKNFFDKIWTGKGITNMN